MRRIATALGVAFTLALVAPAGAASLVTAPGGIAPEGDIIRAQAQVVAPGGPAAVRGPRGNVVVPRGGARVVAPAGRRGGPVVVQQRRGGRGAGVAAGVAAGLIGGALIGGALAPQPEPEVVVAPRRRVVVEEDEPVYVQPRCMSFRSYDPDTGTYIDRNGIERICR